MKSTGRAKLWPVAVGAVTAASATLCLMAVRASLPLATPDGKLYLTQILPFALLHIFVLLCIRLLLGPGSRGILLFWSLSWAALVVAGGKAAVLSCLGLVFAAVVLSIIGRGISAILFGEEQDASGISLGLGIIFASFFGALLALAHAFRVATALCVLGVGSVLGAMGMRRSRLAWLRSRLSSLAASPMPASAIMVLEGLFLLGAFGWVAASVPETRNDALRVYLPYVRLLSHFDGFFDLPSQWAFVVPQAGVTYAGMLNLLFGLRVARYAMVLALVALVATILARGRRMGSAEAGAIALLLASCPIVLGTAASLMQEAFVCLVVVILGIICLEGPLRFPIRFWCAAGALGGTALMAKYTTAVYVFPLGLIAFGRSRRAFGWRRSLLGLAAGAGAALAASSPWLWHAYRLSGDPFFPFLVSVFRAPNWPHGLGKANLGMFHLRPGAWGWLSWPWDMTVHTEKFVEGIPGYLGAVLPVILVLVVPLLWVKGGKPVRAWIALAAAGTAALWTQTAYIRYWLPGVWLLAAPATLSLSELSRGTEMRRRVFAIVALIVLALHIPIDMAFRWGGPQGWLWDHYTGKVDDAAIEDRISATRILRELHLVDPNFPCVWYSALIWPGYADIVPLAATPWEFGWHGFRRSDVNAMISYIEAARCDYWIADESQPSAHWFRETGVSHDYWTQRYLVAFDGPVSVYRMPSSARALASVARNRPEMLAPMADLLVNGMLKSDAGALPEGWQASGSPEPSCPSPLKALGPPCVRVKPGQTLHQEVRFPSGVGRLFLSEWCRSAFPRWPSLFRSQVNWIDSAGRPLSASIAVYRGTEYWAPFRRAMEVPAGAARAVVYLAGADPVSTTDFRDVHLYVMKGP